MNRYSMTILGSLAVAGALCAQQATTEATALKAAYNGIKNNISKAAAKMPDDQYGFKATPDIRTYGALIAHITDANGRTCAAVAGSTPPGSAGSKTSKADLVEALKASFDICDGVFNSLSDEDATKTVSAGRGGPRPKFAVLWGVVTHSNEMYGYMSVYMRLKGVVPPSSEPRQ